MDSEGCNLFLGLHCQSKFLQAESCRLYPELWNLPTFVAIEVWIATLQLKHDFSGAGGGGIKKVSIKSFSLPQTSADDQSFPKYIT